MLIALFGMISIEGLAQTRTGKVNGSVIDGNTKTIESATITLLKAKDSVVINILLNTILIYIINY